MRITSSACDRESEIRCRRRDMGDFSRAQRYLQGKEKAEISKQQREPTYLHSQNQTFGNEEVFGAAITGTDLLAERESATRSNVDGAEANVDVGRFKS